MRHSLPILLLIFLTTLSCGSKYKTKDVQQKNAFYFWKSDWGVNERTFPLLDSLEVKVCYLKFFDVAWDEKEKEVIPVGRSGLEYGMPSPPKHMEIIPTIFVSNDVIKNLSEEQLKGLAHSIYRKTKLQFGHIYNRGNDEKMGPKLNTSNSDGPYKMTYEDLTWPEKDTIQDVHSAFEEVKEIQIDCDWTESTKDKYFKFLQMIKDQFKNKLISCTIRMYPYKYPTKAGVPPVDKGMLMIYNVGDVTKVESGNSIFDKKEILKYLNGKEKYPLVLDYAFPIFEWLSVYRNNKLIQLLPSMATKFISPDDKRMIISEKNNQITRYEAKEEVYLYPCDFTLQKGDVMKLESISYEDVAEVAAKISSINTNPTPNISLFQFDYGNVQQHQKEIAKIYSQF